jgi:hypothetical protein
MSRLEPSDTVHQNKKHQHEHVQDSCGQRHSVPVPSGASSVYSAFFFWSPSIDSTLSPEAHCFNSRTNASKNSCVIAVPTYKYWQLEIAAPGCQLTSSVDRFPLKWSISSSVTSNGTNVLQKSRIASVRWADGFGKLYAASAACAQLSNAVCSASFLVFIAVSLPRFSDANASHQNCQVPDSMFEQLEATNGENEWYHSHSLAGRNLW